MIDFANTFNDNCQYYLKEISYKTIVIGQGNEKASVQVHDTLSFEIIDDYSLRVEIKRTVDFIPNTIYNLSVAYGTILIKKDESIDIKSIDWDKEFRGNPLCLILIQSLLARISLQISQITSSCGQIPVVTPPRLIN